MFYSVNICIENYKDGKWQEEFIMDSILKSKKIFVFALNDDDAIKQIENCIEHNSNETTRIVMNGKIQKGYGLLHTTEFLGNSMIDLI
nr:MAG TPA: hypothetical protein [Caudoviricetes sp.]